jgi:hypothetical protein
MATEPDRSISRSGLLGTVARTPPEVQALLLDRERAVLGTVPRLLHLRGEGVAWAPADDLCLAGQLLLEHPGGDAWTLSGRVFEILGSEES